MLVVWLGDAQAAFVRLENFDRLALGNLHGQNGWVASAADGQVVVDPDDPCNRVLAVTGIAGNVYRALGPLAITNNPAATLFFRMRRANATPNLSAGLSDVAAPIANSFGDFEAQLNCNTLMATNLNVRDATVFRTIGSFTNDEWYNVWMVVNNPADLVSVYLQGGTLTEPTVLQATNGEYAFTFRNTTGDAVNLNTNPQPNALVTFNIKTTTGHVGPFYVDDIYLDLTGTNLALPLYGTNAPVVAAVQPPPGATLITLTEIAVGFDKSITNIAAGDLLINGTPATNLSSACGQWTFGFAQPSTGVVTVAWAADQQIADRAGNRFAGTNVWTYTLLPPDDTPPVLISFDPPPGAVLTNLYRIVVTFDEPVADVDAEDLLVNGAPALLVTNSGNVYSFMAPPQPPGEVRVGFDRDHGISDLSGNGFDATADAHRWSYTLVDVLSPRLTQVSPTPGATVSRLDTVEVLFSEPVTGVDAGDLLVNGAPATNVTGGGLGPYRFTFPPPAVAGVVQFRWAAGHDIQDLAESPNTFTGLAWTNLLASPGTMGTVIINEFLANNVQTLTNEFGECEDWIELFNPGTNAVDLLGWSLTDDPKNPGLWVFPHVLLGPGQYLVVFADGRDRRPFNGITPCHTNFKLNDQGDYLALCSADFPRPVVSALEPQFPEQRPDYSYGRNATNGWSYYATPTPGGPNGDSSITGVVPLPHVNASRGLYDQPFTLLAACALPEAALRYTTDGSVPTEAGGQPYTGPLVISNTTIFRLAAFASNCLPSRVSTHSFIFIDQVLRQPNQPPGYPVGSTVWSGYPSDFEMDPDIITTNFAAAKASLLSLPTLCIAMKVDDLFGATNGIYTNPEPPPADRYKWERPCSAEFILTNGQTGFHVDCGVRIQGNASRTPLKTPKHPFRLLFKGAYGPGRLDYPVYPESPVRSFNDLVLRAEYNNSWVHWEPPQCRRGSRVRDAWTKETFRAMNGISGHSRPFHLYLNGLYWGVYDFGERIDAQFAASYLGGKAEEWDAIASKPTEAIDGDLIAYNAMVNLGRNSDLAQPSNYLLLQQRLDLPVFLDYMILNFYGANADWGFDGNWNAICRRAPGETFKYVTWDGEQLLVSNLDNKVSNTDVPSGLHTNLVNSAQYRLDFADRVHRYCFNQGVLTPGPAAGRWSQLARDVEPGMLAESARWGDYRKDVKPYADNIYDLYRTNTHWWPEIERVRTNYFPVRTDIFLGQLRAAGLYPNIAAPVFNQHGGHVPYGFALTMTATNPVYYTTNGNDPRVVFSGAIGPDALLGAGPVPITSSLLVKARARWGTNWSALNEAFFELPALGCPLRVTEIMYNPIGGDAYEFIELRHCGSTPLDVSGWSFGGISFTFSAGTILAPGQILVLANSLDPAAFALRYPGVSVFGYFARRLNNGGERLALSDAAGKIMLAVDYGNSGGWVKTADGQGYSLELIDPFGDPNAASNWGSTAYNGTPGTVSPVFSGPAAVRLNEVMAENVSSIDCAGTFPDWVELYNASAGAVDLAGWSLTDDSNARKFVFPADTVIAAGGYLVAWCDTNFALPGLHTGFSLARSGETVSLFNAATTRVDAVTYGLQLIDYSLGRVADGWSLTLPTPGAENALAPLAGQTNLVLNEWLANAPPGAPDWLELFNPATNPVPLAGLYLAQSNGVHQIRSLSFLDARGYLQLFADELPGVDHLDFKLPAGGGVIVLYDAAARELDRVTYDPQVEGVSQGRLPDGVATITNFLFSPSPGAGNYIPSYRGPVLNEVMARNHTGATNAAGHIADWVELYNPLETNFNLGGFGLSTVFGNPLQWVFPAGAAIPAQGHLVVWFDALRAPSVTNEAELNAGRALNGDSDQVYLANPAGLVVDEVVFGPQAQDYSIGRAGGIWTLLATPTPGAANAAPAALGSPAGLRFNEWLASSGLGQADFIELFNPAPQPVELSGLYLTDDLSLAGVAKFQVAPLSYIDAYGFADFKADGDVAQGRNHLSFRLDSDAESLRLSSSTLGILDTVYFGAQAPGVSEGRLPDGGASTTTFTCPTPGASNSLAAVIFITTQPASQVVRWGTNVSLSVSASGGGTLGYQWFFNNTAITGATTATLQFSAVQPADAGDYVVLVSNACAAVTSAVATLTVEGPPINVPPGIAAQPLSRTNTVGEAASFSVTASSELPVTYQWRFREWTLPGATNAVLRLNAITVTNGGDYRVLVSNSAGEALSEAATLTVAGPPCLSDALVMEGNRLQFSLSGQLYRNYLIEWSSNLVNWSLNSPATLTTSPQRLTGPGLTNSTSGFFRARLVPEEP